MSERLAQLRRRWAQQARERGEEQAAIDLENVAVDENEAGEGLDRDAVLAALREEPETPIGSEWRRP